MQSASDCGDKQCGFHACRKMMPLLFLLLLSLLTLSSCQRTAASDEEICRRSEATPLPPGRFEWKGLAVQPPSGQGWLPCYREDKKENQESIEFLDRSPVLSGSGSVGHTVVAGVEITDLEPYMNASAQLREARRADILRAVIGSYVGVNSPERIRVLEHSVTYQGSPALECLRFDSSVEDRGVPGKAGQIFSMDLHGIACFHPKASSTTVVAQYSERAPQGEKPLSGLKEVGEAFLSSLAFVP